MQSDQQFYCPISCEVGGGFTYNGPILPALGATLSSSAKHSRLFHDVELQPSELCPNNFLIFDQTDRKSRVMYHPALDHKSGCPSIDVHAAFVQDEYSEDERSSYSLKEDSKDIDALLCFEEDEQEEDEEELSTARTLGSLGGSSPDSCSSYGSKRSKSRFSSHKKMSSCSNGERKQVRMKKMVKALREIVPGADQMNTVAILDEAVRYLKSLKVEVKKLGVGDLDN